MTLNKLLTDMKDEVDDTNIWVEILNINQFTLATLYLEDFGNFGLEQELLDSEVVDIYYIEEKEEPNPIAIIEVKEAK